MKTIKQRNSPTAIKWLISLTFTALLAFIASSCGKNNESSVNGKELKELTPAPQTHEETISSEPLTAAEKMPVFPGGDQALLKFIAENTHYPESAKINGIAGRVIARFAIDIDGKVKMVSILKGASPELDAEALRVINTLPDFKPGEQGGKPVPVWYMVPITFALK